MKKKQLLFEWLIPSIVGLTSFIMSYFFHNYSIHEIIDKSFPHIGTLLGFTLAALTLLLSSDKMVSARQYEIDGRIRGKKATLYDMIVVSYSYLIIVEGILCIGYFIADALSFIYIHFFALLINAIYITLMFNILFVTIRTITDMYFILVSRR